MILFNTDIDGVPASGVAAEDIHHIVFIPKATTLDPELPSGSLWLRPYDGEMEMFTYQGTSGILEVLNGQGYASYHQNDLNSLSTSVPVITTFQWREVQDSGFISAGNFPDNGSAANSDFTINANGLYRICYNFIAANASGGGAADGRVQARALANGSEITGSNTKAYFSTASNGGEGTCSTTVMVSLNAGDLVQFELEVLTAGGTMTYHGFVSFELIRPETP
ncbi:MAG: hypothetical protein ACXABY_01745 [Candidatus Thorarchaeota archaeon]|jgi:hypothetical protein